MNFEFEVTVKRKLHNDPLGLGTRFVMNDKGDLDEFFTPKVVKMILESYAKELENEK